MVDVPVKMVDCGGDVGVAGLCCFVLQKIVGVQKILSRMSQDRGCLKRNLRIKKIERCQEPRGCQDVYTVRTCTCSMLHIHTCLYPNG